MSLKGGRNDGDLNFRVIVRGWRKMRRGEDSVHCFGRECALLVLILEGSMDAMLHFGNTPWDNTMSL